MRRQVVIVGAGPAGLLLGHILIRHGIDAVILERRDRSVVEARVRAGVLEAGTVALLGEIGLDDRLRRDGLIHGGFVLQADGDAVRIDLAELTGTAVVVYGQQDLVKDLLDAAAPRGLDVVFGVEDVGFEGLHADRPSVRYTVRGIERRLDCDIVAGCDGFHGASRAAVPAGFGATFERVYPAGWLGLLADVPPAGDELIYASHERGFALASMRSRTRSRYYIQCAVDEPVSAWSDGRFWDELCLRLGPDVASRVTRGASFEKTVAPLRSFVHEPMRYGRLFLAGDAAHIVPPTGAKGLNLAAADVALLGAAIAAFFEHGDTADLDAYSARALERVWQAERFSWWFTGLTHRFPEADPFARRMQLAEFAHLRGSRAARTALAESYVGRPIASLRREAGNSAAISTVAQGSSRGRGDRGA